MIAVGKTIGNYTITAKLGEGGMGVVYLAEHPVIGRKVAMKAIHPELSRNAEVVSRFMTEAKSVNQIGNDHIVDIHDFGTTKDGEFYFIMEFLQGDSVADRLKRERVFAAPRALQIAAQVADALAASHGHGIIHRDLKPENIFLITKGTNADFVKVLDFGLAKLTQGEDKASHKTRTGSVMGTPYYMAPEQCEGKSNIDHRSDLYSLGVILYEMMTGSVPFTGEGYGEIIVKHITQPPPAPRSYNPELTMAHEALLMRALAKNREERFQSMAEFRTAMLDPDRYLATAPESVSTTLPMGATIAAVPGALGGSGLSRFGRPTAADVTPEPSTFRHGVGEVLDDDVMPARSRKPLLLAVAAAVLAAGAAAVVLMKPWQSDEQPKVASPPEAETPPAPAVPGTPDKVTIKFESRPGGAQVMNKGTGEALGTTPFDHEFPYGKEPVDLVLKKAGFEEQPMSVVPDMPRGLSTTLVAERVAVETPAAKPSVKSTPKPSVRPGRSPSGKGKKRTLNDEDGVIEPSFK